ncbi:uncharacterized protein LOC109837242 isoform X2 [Asparagus officinalis]|uniref:uncharacterized protein LOC109837242 isoform X2 n=1 Tax=Asparagus officinalis TaxID=4686 RepID=UPI00098E20D7|nr:uncharacterized protein LOC109837242 isoform X2 [Asparagus officinalis]
MGFGKNGNWLKYYAGCISNVKIYGRLCRLATTLLGSSTTKAILLISECKTRSLTNHIPNLTSLRNVPIISIKDNKGGSISSEEAISTQQ